MHVLLTIAWRNIWRHPARSGVLTAAVAVGLWAAVMVIGWANGLMQQRLDYVIERELTHVQVHHPGFPADGHPWDHIPGHDQITAWLDEHPQVRSHASRTITDGMLQSPVKTSGVRIRGIDVAAETRTTTFHENMVHGEFLDADLSNPAVISRILADEHNMRIGNRIVLTFENADRELTSSAFHISGLFASASSEYDKRNIFVRSDDLTEILAGRPIFHEIGVMLVHEAEAEAFAAMVNDRFDGVLAQTWRELSPELSMIVELGDVMVLLISLIIMAALGFGILNTMLMALFERLRELGMLLSIGMSKLRVFCMIMLEALVLTFSGALAGMALAWLSIRHLGKTGINLEMFAQGAALIGFDYLIYPFLSAGDFVLVSLVVVSVTLAASLYPALKAVRVHPLEAARDG